MSDLDALRYEAAMHAIQTGVMIDHERGSQDGTPKHLRVGVNSAMVNQDGLATLLMAKGLITADEYEKAIADAAEREVVRYRERLNLPDNVALA